MILKGRPNRFLGTALLTLGTVGGEAARKTRFLLVKEGLARFNAASPVFVFFAAAPRLDADALLVRRRGLKAAEAEEAEAAAALIGAAGGLTTKGGGTDALTAFFGPYFSSIPSTFIGSASAIYSTIILDFSASGI